MHPPKTCAIIVSFNGAADTVACVQSLIESVVPVGIVVVDTTPNDPQLGIALEFAPMVTLVRASENVGFGRGNNLGIEWALNNISCEYIFLLNNDAVIYPESIKRLEDAMAVEDGVGIMAPRIAYLDDPGKLWYGGGEIDWRRSSAVAPGFNRSANTKLAMTERDVTFASGCALFVRASVFLQLGGFDPRFFMYEEDLELCLRAVESGIRIRYNPHSLVLHRAQGSSRDANSDRYEFWSVENPKLPFYTFHVIRNRMLNVYLHARGWQRLTAMAFFPLMLARRAVPFLMGGRIDAVVAMFQGIADSWQARRSTGTTT